MDMNERFWPTFVVMGFLAIYGFICSVEPSCVFDKWLALSIFLVVFISNCIMGWFSDT